nr:hypothetical protein [Tanacetum cinerariifolium]
MLDKTNYSSWASRMLLYIKGKEHGKLLVDSILNGPFQYGTIVELGNETTPATVRARTYTDLTDEEKIRESVDIKETNIVLQGLPQYIYNLVNHNEDAKQIWDRVKLLIQGSELSLQERESKLYDDFKTFTSMPRETIHSYYMWFAQLINDMHTIEMKIKPLQVNTKFYQPQVVTNSLVVHQQPYQAPALKQSCQAPTIRQPSSTELDLGLVVPSFNPSDDQIANLNKLMAFISTTFGPCFPHTNNYLRTSSNPRNQASIQDGIVTVQTVQGRQTSGYVNTGARNNVTNQGGNRNGAAAQLMVVKCYNCQEEGQFSRQCTKPKRPKNSAWFKEKMLLTEALESTAYLDPEQLAFLVDNRDTIIPAQASQEILTPTAFQTDDLDAFDSDCDDVPLRKVTFAESIDISKDKTQKQVQPQAKHATNNYVSSSTGVSSSTEASKLKRRSNTKKDRITQTSSSNKKKNKVKDQPRIAKSSLNNLNHVSKTVCNVNVKHSVLNANSELICATCHECMFDAIHDLCVRDYLIDVNARAKSQSVKSKNAKRKKKRMWKPTGKVYTNVGYKWKPEDEYSL